MRATWTNTNGESGEYHITDLPPNTVSVPTVFGSLQLTPHCCPVCYGRGLVPHGFYYAIGSPTFTSNGGDPEPCRSCEKGVIWK